MPSRPHWPPRAGALAAVLFAIALAGCGAGDDGNRAAAPTGQAREAPGGELTGVMLDMQLNEVSGLTASHLHDDVLWLHDDGDNPPRLFAVDTRGSRLATFGVEGVTKTDWEDIAGFELDDTRYLLIADVGDNGGLRRTLQLHVVEEPTVLRNARLQPAWSIAFRWPDGPRDCEAVAVDPVRGEVLLVSKKREPPELFSLPLRPPAKELLTAQRIGTLAGVPTPDAERATASPRRARLDGQVTAAAVSPDRNTLAVMTYRYLLLYPRPANGNWADAVAGTPRTSELPWLPQAEALGWSPDGRSLYATGEFIPAPLYRIDP